MQRDSISNTIQVALTLCLICSVVVSMAAVGLRSRQQANRDEFMQRKILEVAGLVTDTDANVDVGRLFRSVDTKIVDLETGAYDTTIPIDTYDQAKAANDPALSKEVIDDIASISRRETFSLIYEVEHDGKQLAVLPIRGYGLWSTLRGFIALDLTHVSGGLDKIEVKGIAYYSHAETPGLGGEVDNPRWKEHWPGKHVYDDAGNVRLGVAKEATGDFQVDALSGATITSRGVSNMLHYWLGDQGFKPFLVRFVQPTSTPVATSEPAKTLKHEVTTEAGQ